MNQTLIILDGPSGAGKTALAKAMQEELLPNVWLTFSMDSLVYGLPNSILEKCNNQNDWSCVDNDAMYSGAFSCVESLLKSGHSVIFDVVITNEKRANELKKKILIEHKPALVGVYCDWGELKRRTIARGDRTIEEAEYGFENSPKHFDYSYIIDTTQLLPNEAAEICMQAIEHI